MPDDDVVTNGCTGACCAAFTLPYTIEEMRARIEPTPGEDGEILPALRDAEQIADMVIPLTTEEARERLERFDDTSPPLPDRLNFTCRHWDEETTLCTIYEDRPSMCRDYPYGKPCQHGCTCVGEERPT